MTDILLRIYVRRSSGPAIFILLFLSAAVLLIISLIPVIRYFLYRRNVTGRVADIEIIAGRHGRRDRLIVEYECDGTIYTVSSFYAYTLPDYEVGDNIPVRVSEKHPENAMLPYDLDHALSSLALSGGVLVIGLVVLIVSVVLSNN